MLRVAAWLRLRPARVHSAPVDAAADLPGSACCATTRARHDVVHKHTEGITFRAQAILIEAEGVEFRETYTIGHGVGCIVWPADCVKYPG